MSQPSDNLARYAGQAFHESFRNGKASGEISLTDVHVQFQNDQGQVRFSIQGARFKLGGASDRLLFISHPSQPDWNLYTSDLSILKHPALQNDPEVQQQVRQVRNTKRWAWGVFGSMGALIVAIPLCIILFMDSITALLAPQVPVEWETSMGEKAFEQYTLGQELLDREATDSLLMPLVQPLLEHLDDDRYEYRFHISRDEQVNAFALPGGFIIINSGLILKADSAAEVLGVVAHEIAHVTEQHSVRNIMGTAGVYITVNALLGDMTGLLSVMVSAAPLLINQSYSRGFESEADELGLALLHRAAIDPEGLITFFEKLREQEQKHLQDTAGEDNREAVETTLQFLSTHPATDKRIKHLRERINALPHQRHRDLQTEFEALQERVKLFVAEEDQPSS
ncbi:MAG: M48 family metallopeptidase [Pseudomonadota bacterium]|nr:M48 family metallopeptidase [Pseudomonadota bacterium]